MANNPFEYPFQPQPVTFQQQPQETFFGRQPADPDEPEPKPTYPPGTLICDWCERRIDAGDEGIASLYGKAGVSPQSGRHMILPNPDIPNGDWDVHFGCLPEFLLEHLPEIADQILTLRAEYGYDDDPIQGELFCANCDSKIENDNDG